MSDSKDPQFYFEAAAKFTEGKKAFWIRPNLIDLASNVNELKKRIARLTNELGTSKNDIVKRAFLAGLAVLEYEILNDEKDNMFGDSPYVSRISKLAEVREKKECFKNLQEIYQDYRQDIEGFIQWCQETNQPYYQEFLDGHTMPITVETNTSDKIRTWLFAHLPTEETHHSQVKEQMITEGVISSDDFNLLKYVVSSEGFSGNGRKSGYWSKAS